MRYLIQCLILALTICSSAFAQTPAAPAAAAPKPAEPVLGAGDVVRITVYQNPDLTVDNGRISESGQINFPLIGSVGLGGLTVSAGEQKIAKALRDGGFVLRPQVTIQIGTIRSSVVSVLGNVTRPGRYPIEVVGTKVSEMIAASGGVTPVGGDVVTLAGMRNGKAIKLDIDLPAILQAGKSELDLPVENGDILFVDRAPSAYIYGEVQKPGQFRIERGMSLMQALAQAGGLTPKGTERGIKLHRRDANGSVTITEPRMNDPVQRDDVFYVKESLF
jgi:polysaccharide export outer membrane protein